MTILIENLFKINHHLLQMLKTLDEITPELEPEVGGKAYSLAFMHQRGILVPQAIVLNELPNHENWEKIQSWWQSLSNAPLAARSSAVGEDSLDFSFAGQFVSILDISSLPELKNAVKTCFQSLERTASRAYQKHFDHNAPKMNVVIQKMIQPRFSGVYFSTDPRNPEANENWILEAIEGQGEALVSGQVTPYLFHQNQMTSPQFPQFKEQYVTEIKIQGEKIRAFYDFHIDMEWAIDDEGQLWILQARPVTARNSQSSHKLVIDQELKRLKENNDIHTLWDGQTFAEWTGVPSELTFSLWQRAFSLKGAYEKALRELGYQGYDKGTHPESILERVYGRAYLNLSHLKPLYFGEIPYDIVADPRPHLKFKWPLVNFKMLLKAPFGLLHMMKVGWNAQSHRKDFLMKARVALQRFEKNELKYAYAPSKYEKMSHQELIHQIQEVSELFTQKALKWPFVLIILIESTLQSLEKFLQKFYKEEAKNHLNQWMAHGLKTETMGMYEVFNTSDLTPDKIYKFFSNFGHRATGELELSHPRWIEISEKLNEKFKIQSENSKKSNSPKSNYDKNFVKNEIEKIPKLYQSVIIQEWQILKSLLELRESWKMQIMKPYARLRWYVLELGRRLNLNENVFWYTLDEILKNEFEDIKLLERQQKAKIFSHISFPPIVSLDQIEKILKGDLNSSASLLSGVGISPGLIFGEILIIKSPEVFFDKDFHENTIIVAEAIDPGWTPLFQKAKGVIVSQGGILSHCAIVAREMGLPAVSGILNATNKFKNGQKVWLDGTHGHISLDTNI